jgi:hypothetical protein
MNSCSHCIEQGIRIPDHSMQLREIDLVTVSSYSELLILPPSRPLHGHIFLTAKRLKF